MPSFSTVVNNGVHAPARLRPGAGEAVRGLPPAAATISRMKECPLCGETMRLSAREIQERIPGTGQPSSRVTREWVCPECDYFEEAEPGEE